MNSDQQITAGELHAYVQGKVQRQAIRLGREQTPQLQGDKDKVMINFK